MDSRFAEACHHPFANGTEFLEWTAKWCRHCAREHGEHPDGPGEPLCDLLTASLRDDQWPEGWIPEPDDGRFFLPSRMICTAFTPCEPCGGDPGAADRAERVAEVIAYWREDVD